MEYSRTQNPNRKMVEDYIGDLFNGKSILFISREMALYSVIHNSNTEKVLFSPNSRIKRELSDKFDFWGNLLNFKTGDYSTFDKNVEDASLAFFNLQEWEMLNKKYVSKKLSIAVEVTIGDVMRDRNLRNFISNHFKVKYLIVKVNKIFRDRPMSETFVVARSEEEIKPLKVILNTMGANPCMFNCFEMLNNFKMLNLFQ